MDRSFDLDLLDRGVVRVEKFALATLAAETYAAAPFDENVETRFELLTPHGHHLADSMPFSGRV